MCDRLFLRPDLVTTMELQELSDSFDVIGVFYDKVERSYYLSSDCGIAPAIPWEAHRDREDFTGPLTYRYVLILLDAEHRASRSKYDELFNEKYWDTVSALRRHATDQHLISP